MKVLSERVALSAEYVAKRKYGKGRDPGKNIY